MAGYSGTPLAKKLGIKPGSTLLLDGLDAKLHTRADFDIHEAERRSTKCGRD